MLFDLLANEEKECIESFISTYAYEPEYSNKAAPLSYILRFWDIEKNRYLYRMFEEQLILHKKISYKKSSDELLDDIDWELLSADNYKNDKCQIFINSFLQMVEAFYDKQYYVLRSLLYGEHLVTNTYSGPTHQFSTPQGKKIKIQEGSKISKILGKFAEAYDLPHYEDFRIRHSQILNQKKLEGDLYLSIHPIDYITMSTNSCGWTSCMDWTTEGEYRRGTVEMMNSPMVIVAYLASETPINLFGLNVSNKKWRELFIVTPEIITGIKGYPYYNSYLEEVVCKWLKELAEKNLNWKYESEGVNYDTGLALDPASVIFTTNVMYNDFNNKETTNYGYLGVNKPKDIVINYSGYDNCMCCGNISGDYPDDEGCLICGDCSESWACCCCDSVIYEASPNIVDGEYYCDYCYDRVIGYCHQCGQEFPYFDMKDVYLAYQKDDMWNILNRAIHYCPHCFESKYLELEKLYHYKRGIEFYFIDCEDCDEEMLSDFGCSQHHSDLKALGTLYHCSNFDENLKIIKK